MYVVAAHYVLRVLHALRSIAHAMRACFVALEHDRLPAFARAVFEAYWGRDEDISQADVLARICERGSELALATWSAESDSVSFASARGNVFTCRITPRSSGGQRSRPKSGP